MSERIVVETADPDPIVLGRAAAVIRDGGVVVFPTDTLYGLAVDPFNPKAVERIFAVKGRTPDQPIALVAADAAQVERDIGVLSSSGQSLAVRFWPGALTLLLEAPKTLVPGIVATSGLVGIRVPAHEVARALCRASGRVLTATSANRSGEPASAEPDPVWAALGDRVDLMLDAGTTPGGAPSTIVDVSSIPPRLVRAGAISWDTITEWLHI